MRGRTGEGHKVEVNNCNDCKRGQGGGGGGAWWTAERGGDGGGLHRVKGREAKKTGGERLKGTDVEE